MKIEKGTGALSTYQCPHKEKSNSNGKTLSKSHTDLLSFTFEFDITLIERLRYCGHQTRWLFLCQPQAR